MKTLLLLSLCTMACLPVAAFAQTPVSVASWNFGTTTFRRDTTTQSPACSRPVYPFSSSIITMTGGLDKANADVACFAITSGWPSTQTPELDGTRTSFTNPMTQPLLWTRFTLADNARGDFTGLALKFKVRAALTMAAPNQVRAWVTWHDGTTMRTRSTPVTSLSPSTSAWSQVNLSFTQGSYDLPTGLSLERESFLVEMQFFGGTGSPTRMLVDNVELTTTDLTGYYPLEVLRTTLPACTLQRAYTAILEGQGGIPPYTWAVSGSLPSGLSLNASTGIISGTPGVLSSTSFTARLTDSMGTVALRSFSLPVRCPPLNIISKEPLLGIEEGQAVTHTFLLQGAIGAPTWNSVGTLPPGLSLSNLGILSGTPTAAGTYRFWVRGNEASSGCPASRYITILVAPQSNAADLAISPPSVPAATHGISYTTTLLATGGTPPYTWSVSQGSLPAGLSLNSSTGVISGTPTALSTQPTPTFTVSLTDSASLTDTQDYTLPVLCRPMNVVLDESMENLYVNRPVMAHFTLLGATTAATWTYSGSMPPGLSLTSAGTLSGSPTSTGTYTLWIIGTEASGCRATRRYSWVVSNGYNYAVTFAAWRQQYGISGGATDDHDFDGVTNLVEYGLGTSPSNGTALSGKFRLYRSSGTSSNTIRAEITRPVSGLQDLTYSLETLSDLSASPSGWTTVTRTPTSQVHSGGNQQWVWDGFDVASGGGAVPQLGFVRLRVHLDADRNGTPELSSVSQAWCWQRLISPEAGSSRSLGLSLMRPEGFAGKVASMMNGNRINLTLISGSTSDMGDIVRGGHYYVEVLSGSHEGHRLEVSETECAGKSIVVELSNAQSTLTSLPAGLLNARVALRPHWTFGTAFDAAQFAANTSGTASTGYHRLNAYVPSTNSYNTYVSVSGTWKSVPSTGIVATSSTQNLNTTPIREDEGYILRVASTGLPNVTFLGLVRDTAFAQPLSSGSQLRINPWPLSLSPANRGMTAANGFAVGTGDTDADTALQFSYTSGTPPTEAWLSYYYSSSTSAWEPVTGGSPGLSFAPFTATMLRKLASHDSWVQPCPWTP
jgi:hypothetical protein